MNQVRLVLVALGLLFSRASAQIETQIETGVALTGYNDIRIPGGGGTRFSLSDDLKADAALFYRLRLFAEFRPRHHVGVLVAPLVLKSKGALDQDLVFRGETFPAATPLRVRYQFHSYRLVYRYDVVEKEQLTFGLGLSAKIRHAEVRVEGGGLEAARANVGFVPLIHFRLLWKASPRVSLLLDGDALAAPQGRAEDVLAAVLVQAGERVDGFIGYRILEGGADNDKVYSFALIHYASIGAQIRF